MNVAEKRIINKLYSKVLEDVKVVEEKKGVTTFDLPMWRIPICTFDPINSLADSLACKQSQEKEGLNCPRCDAPMLKKVACEEQCPECGGLVDCSDFQWKLQ